jgi:hypothetical protein
MKKISLFFILFAFLAMTLNAQDKQDTKNTQEIIKLGYAYTVGLNVGYDNNFNAFTRYPNHSGNDFYKLDKFKTHFSIGLDYGFMISRKFRPRIEFKYTQMGYGASWANTPMVNTLEKTEIIMYNMSLNLRMDYMVVDKNKFQMFVSPGFKWEAAIDKQCKNFRYQIMDGENHSWDNYNRIIEECPNNIAGGSLSAILKYNITKKIGFVVVPDYTLYFREWVKSNNTIYQRASINFGVEFNFY